MVKREIFEITKEGVSQNKKEFVYTNSIYFTLLVHRQCVFISVEMMVMVLGETC
jgi:hypothetical protein